MKGKQVIEVCTNYNDTLFTASITVLTIELSHSHAIFYKKGSMLPRVSFERKGEEGVISKLNLNKEYYKLAATNPEVHKSAISVCFSALPPPLPHSLCI